MFSLIKIKLDIHRFQICNTRLVTICPLFEGLNYDDQNTYPFIVCFTCYSKYRDHAVCQGQVQEQGGGPLLPHPSLHQIVDGEGVANCREDHQDCRNT